MRLLVTGREGQVARSLLALNGPDVSVTALGRPALDITDAASVRWAVEAEHPDIVVNAAAYTAVDKAETDEASAFAVNRDGAANVATAAASAGVPVIHLSTDYVFPGTKVGPYVETEATGPQGAYGRSKLAGEEAVVAAARDHAILRTAWVYAPTGHNFLRTMLRLAETRDTVRVVADQRGTPTYAPDIALAIVAVAKLMLARPDDARFRGVFHMVAGGETTWAGFAEEIFVRAAERGGLSARVEPITTADYPTPAARPANSRLDTAKFRAAFDHALPDWRDGVRRCLDALGAARP